VDFFEVAERKGFTLAQDRPSRDAWIYSAAPNRYLTYWLHVYTDGSALLTWEYAITDYLVSRSVQLGSSETLNLFMFPVEDLRGAQDPAWLTGAIDSVEAQLQSLDFLNPE
jgi:hypothetical protein